MDFHLVTRLLPLVYHLIHYRHNLGLDNANATVISSVLVVMH
jgi:hypothetical protein